MKQTFIDYFQELIKEKYLNKKMLDYNNNIFVVQYVSVEEDYDGITIFLSDQQTPNYKENMKCIIRHGFNDMPEIIEMKEKQHALGMPDVIPPVIAKKVTDEELEKTLNEYCENARKTHDNLFCR